MNLNKTELETIETEPTIVNEHPARISELRQVVKEIAYQCYRLTWYTTDAKRKHKSYPTREAARKALAELARKNVVEAERQKVLRHRIGVAGKKLDTRRLLDAVEALDLLGDRATLVEAVKEYIQRHPVGPMETIRQTCDRYLAAMKENGARESSIADKRVKFGVFCRDMGKTPTVQLDERTAEEWLKRRKFTRATEKSYGTAIKNLINFHAGRKRKRHLADERLPETWTVGQVRTLFASAEQKVPEIIPAMVVLWFAGIRPEEMLRLSWENVDLTSRTLHVPPEVAKTRTSRVVDIGEHAVEWLLKYRNTGKIVTSQATYRRLRARLQGALGMEEWPRDCPRHTFATMLYKATENLNRTMEQLGHFGSSNVFVRHYKGQPVTREQAAEYFDIRPGGGVQAKAGTP